MILVTNMEANNLFIEELKFTDIEKLKSWGSYTEPLLYGYNYNDLNSDQELVWYLTKQIKFRSSYFSINLDSRMIGFIGVKEINKFLKTGKLGIVFDPNFVSQGYGFEVMKIFLDLYFNEMNMRKMTLEVNAWNFRAIKLYEKLGFKKYRENYQVFENQNLDLQLEKYDQVRRYFVEKDNKIYSQVYFMKLDRQEYINES